MPAVWRSDLLISGLISNPVDTKRHSSDGDGVARPGDREPRRTSMYELDLLPVEGGGSGSKSGDAITTRFTTPLGREAVIVVDGGFSDDGQRLVDHIDMYYDTASVDLVISTHPDADHLNGLATVLTELNVAELMIHQPWLHLTIVTEFSNLEAIEKLIAVAAERGTAVREPFTGERACDGAVTILGPTSDYYAQCVAQHLQEVATGAAAARMASASTVGRLLAKAVTTLSRALPLLPLETLGEDGDSGPRNNSSAITLLELDGERFLLTGDAGIPSLWAAATAYESEIGPFATAPLRFIQPPHHGSRRNLSPTLLDHVIGPKNRPHGITGATVSAADDDPRPPTPQVTNALQRRGVQSWVAGR